MVQKASVIILDEPLANLDKASIQTTVDYLCELATTHVVVVIAHGDELNPVAKTTFHIQSQQLSVL